MKQSDIALLMKGMAPVIGELISKSVQPLVERVAELEQTIADMPTPKDGRDGVDGKDGAPGKDGVDGVAGMDGKDADPVTPEQIAAAVAQYMADNPPPAGKDGTDGKDGAPGEKGADGKDGVGLADALIDQKGALVLTMTDGRTKELGVVVGRDGTDGSVGKDGRDGFSLEDFDAELMDDGRTVLLSFAQGDTIFKAEMGIPAMIYRGVFKEGQEYERGDTVTWGGSLWHCDADKTTEKPDSAAKHWTLAAKKGRDARPAKEEA